MSSSPSSPEASERAKFAVAPAWRAYAHLYFPLFTAAILYLIVEEPFSAQPLLWASALPTYFFASLIHQPRPRPPERFTRSSDLRRAVVLFAYGRLHGTPFNLVNYLMDLLSSYGVVALFDRPEGAAPRRSEFFVQALATLANTLVFSMIPPSWEWAWLIMGGIDRAMYRAAWMALVDDVVKVLAYPDLKKKRGKALVMAVQALLITFSVLWVYFVWYAGMGYAWQLKNMDLEKQMRQVDPEGKLKDMDVKEMLRKIEMGNYGDNP